MIHTYIVHPVTGDDTKVAVDITEKICRPFCMLGQSMPTATVSFSAGAPTISDGIAVFPITAMVTVVSPSQQPCGCARTQVFREDFSLALTATGTNTLTIEEGTTTTVKPAYNKCCKAYGVDILKTFTATIA